MGFTRYWAVDQDLDTNLFRNAARDIRTMLKSEGAWNNVVRWECDSKKQPLCDVRGIRFNGIGDEGHETFGFSPYAIEFDFCKTARKEYDMYVFAAMLILKYHFGPLIDLRDDGPNDTDDQAVQLSLKYFQYKA